MSRRAGFTLIEVLIVVMIIAIIAALALPNLLRAGREGRESQLRAHLYSLRNAIAVFRAQCGGNPASLDDLLAEDATGMVTYEGIEVLEADYHGPYFTATPTGDLPVDPTTGTRSWVYTPATGAVRSGSTWTGLDGTDYSTW